MPHWITLHGLTSINGGILLMAVFIYFGIVACRHALLSILAELAAIRGELEKQTTEIRSQRR